MKDSTMKNITGKSNLNWNPYNDYEIIENNDEIILYPKRNRNHPKIKIDFNNRRVEWAALNLGFNKDDCKIKPKILFVNKDNEFDVRKYNIHRRKVIDAIYDIYLESENYKSKNNSLEKQRYKSIDELRDSSINWNLKNYRLTNFSEMFTDSKSKISPSKWEEKFFKNKGKYIHFEKQEKLRNLLGIKEKKYTEYLKALTKSKSNKILEKQTFITGKIFKIQSRKNELLNNKNKSSIEKFESVMKNEIETSRNEVTENARNKYKKRQQTIEYLIKKERENYLKDIKLQEDNIEIEKKLMNYNNMTQKSFNYKKNIVDSKTIFAKNDILKAMNKLKKTIISRNERELEKGEDYFFTIANIKRAKITRRLLLQMHSENLNAELEYKKDHAQKKILFLETQRQMNIKRKEEEEEKYKLDRDIQAQLFRHSHSSLQLNKQAQESNYLRIKNLKKFKRLKIMEKFEKLHQKNEMDKNFKIMKESRLLKLQFDSIRKKEEQIQNDVQKQKKNFIHILITEDNSKNIEKNENENRSEITEKTFNE